MAVRQVKEEIEMPQGTSFKLDKATLTVKGPKGEVRRTFEHPVVHLQGEAGKLFVVAKDARKQDRALAGTWAAHIHNMADGASKGHTYTMKIVYSHFPIKAVPHPGEFLIENFLGEVHPRTAPILGQTKVEVAGDKVTVTGVDLEAVAGTAANIEQATRIRGFDPRVFQDGIYITAKGE